MVQEKDIAIEFSLLEIRDVEFFVKEVSDELKASFDDDLLKVGYKFGFKVDEENEILIFTLGIKYFYEDKTKPLDILIYFASFSFHVLDCKNLVKDLGDGDFNIDDLLMTNIFGIALSTMRGCIFQKTKNNFINKYYLPIMNPVDFLSKYMPDYDKTNIIGEAG